jgi:HD superfamily phosphodiesterase
MPKHLKPIPEQLIRDFEPQESWLAHDSDIHGVGHMSRVFILQELICDLLERRGAVVNREAVRWAAITHDVGRVDDGLDLEHGRRSAEWIKNNLHDRLSPELIDMVTYIVHWHVPPDEEAPVMTTELKILKDADGLDRVRLGDLDTRYLRTSAALELISIARQLEEHSFPKDQSKNTKETFIDIVRAAKEIGVVS